MNTSMNIRPFENCPALDGYHCQTNSLAKIFHYHNHPLSEDMLLGLGAGMGFIYWKMKMGSSAYVFLGGRGNNKDFFADVEKRTGVRIRSVSTGSVKKAETSLVSKLEKKQTIDAQMNPPIKNMGVKGLRHASKELLKWPDMFKEYDLRMNLFSIYVFIEIGGTGGGCFRYMYSRFLKESAEITRDKRLSKSAEGFERAGEMFSAIGFLFKESEKAEDLDQRIKKASSMFLSVAEVEENIYSELSKSVT